MKEKITDVGKFIFFFPSLFYLVKAQLDFLIRMVVVVVVVVVLIVFIDTIIKQGEKRAKMKEMLEFSVEVLLIYFYYLFFPFCCHLLIRTSPKKGSGLAVYNNQMLSLP